MKTIQEILNVNRNLHLEHFEDLIFEKNGLATIVSLVGNLQKNSSIMFSEKWDGSPSVITGINPDNGKFFVSSKNIFGQEPKLMYTSEDVEKYYPAITYSDLNTKFNIALEHFPKLGINGVLQGDILYTKENLILKGGTLEFKTNTLTYKTANRRIIKRVQESEIGVVFHTEYSGTKLSEMEAKYCYDSVELDENDSVYCVPAIIEQNALNNQNLINVQKYYLDLFTKQQQLLALHSPFSGIDWITDNKIIFKKFTNHCIREELKFDTINSYSEELKKFVAGIARKESSTLKTEGGRKRKIEKYIKFNSDIDVNQKHLQYFGEIISLLVKIKNEILRIVPTNKIFETFIDEKSSAQEGLVMFNEDTKLACKIVNRHEFSKSNFQNRKNWKPKTLKEALQEKKIVFTFARMNPPTLAHEYLINCMIKKAHEIGAECRVYLSPGPKLTNIGNPLSVENRIRYIKMAMPHAYDIIKSDPDITDAYVALKKLSTDGYTDVIFMVGSDRVDTFKDMIQRYSGHPDENKSLNFKTCVVESIGERDPQSEDLPGISSSKMRQYCGAGNFESFSKYGMSNLSDIFKNEMFDIIRLNGQIESMCEDIINLNNTLNKKRHEMPQIDAKDIEKFVKFLDEKGYSPLPTNTGIDTLKPTQNELNSDKINELVNKLTHRNIRPFIVSLDWYILDGHHQLAALKLMKVPTVNCYIVPVNMEKLILIAHEFSLTKTKDIHT